MTDTSQTRADQLLAEALERHGARDPREYFRGQLRELRSADQAAYDQAVGHYKETLLPGIESGTADPLSAWTEYGQLLAQLRSAGSAVTIDATGQSREFALPDALGDLVLHIPEKGRDAAMVVALPANPSPAQLATVDFLVGRKKKLRHA